MYLSAAMLVLIMAMSLAVVVIVASCCLLFVFYKKVSRDAFLRPTSKSYVVDMSEGSAYKKILFSEDYFRQQRLLEQQSLGRRSDPQTLEAALDNVRQLSSRLGNQTSAKFERTIERLSQKGRIPHSKLQTSVILDPLALPRCSQLPGVHK